MPADRLRFRELLHGFETTQTLYIPAKLGIPDLLLARPATAEQLANDLADEPRPLFGVLRMAGACGVLTQDEDDRFGPTSLSDPLRSGTPGSFRDLTILSGEEYYLSAAKLLETIQTGRPSFEIAYGRRFCDYLADQPEVQRTFNASMPVRVADHEAVAARYDCSRFRVVADIGGGRGGLLSAIHRRHPSVAGILFDQPTVVAEADRYLEEKGLRRRCRIVGGNAFQEVPEGADAYIESYFLRDFEDGRTARILQSIRRVIPSWGSLLLVEHVVPSGAAPSFGTALDLRMLELGGLERTEEEWRLLLRRAGFELTKVMDVGIPASVIQAAPTELST